MNKAAKFLQGEMRHVIDSRDKAKQASRRAILAFPARTMERHNRHSKGAPAETRRSFIVASWEAAGKPAVDARLLKSIRAGLQREFEKDEPGPAAVARVLADAGAELKHPEIIEADAEWRQAKIKAGAKEVATQILSSEVMTLSSAERFIAKLEELRQQRERDEDRGALTEIRAIASESRRLAEAIAKNRSAEQPLRVEQAEIAEWLKVWLQTPSLFADWLELRRRSDEFRVRFPVPNREDTDTQS